MKASQQYHGPRIVLWSAMKHMCVFSTTQRKGAVNKEQQKCKKNTRTESQGVYTLNRSLCDIQLYPSEDVENQLQVGLEDTSQRWAEIQGGKLDGWNNPGAAVSETKRYRGGGRDEHGDRCETCTYAGCMALPSGPACASGSGGKIPRD